MTFSDPETQNELECSRRNVRFSVSVMYLDIVRWVALSVFSLVQFYRQIEWHKQCVHFEIQLRLFLKEQTN